MPGIQELNRFCVWTVTGLLSVHILSAESATSHSAADANNTFAFDLYSRLANEPGNLVVSPFSVRTTLAMAYGGARGRTALQMSSTLCLFEQNGDGYAELASLLRDSAQEDPTHQQLTFANSVWVQGGYQILKPFENMVRNQYLGELTHVDFVTAPSAAVSQINRWMSTQTRGKIQNIVAPEKLDVDTRLVLANAVYFEGRWATPFKDTLTLPFHSDGSARLVEVPMMSTKESFRYAANESVQVLELQYAANKFSMIILLPRETVSNSVSCLESEFSGPYVNSLLKQTHEEEVTVYLPRFNLGSRQELHDALRAMGMTDAFSPDDADFRGISKQTGLYLKAILHEAVVEVNEEGTVAAAGTSGFALMGVDKPRTVFFANHPFLFLIRHNPTGAILFVGRVTDPSVK